MRSSVVLFLICQFVSFFYNARSSNILGLFGCASHSHYLWNEVLVNALEERGHTLTILSVDRNKSPRPNVTYIHMEKTHDFIHWEIESLGDSSSPGASDFRNIRLRTHLKMVECRGIVESNGFQDALKLDEKFDLILYDTESGSCMLKLIEKHPNIPVVGVSAFRMDPKVVEMVGGYSYPGYIPHVLKKHEMPMNVFKRISNAATYAYAYLYRNVISERYIEAITKKYIPRRKKDLLAKLYRRISIALVNSHPTTDYAQSLPPNIVQVGGLHIQDPKPLPKNINDFLQSAKMGAVVIVLGSNLKAEILGEKRLQALVNVIQKFPDYNFLWRVDDKGVLKEFPKNLMIQTWIPQNDVLAHPKVKAFFTHAGGLSMQEATFHGVPVVAMPFFADQFNNAYRAQQNGYGRVVTFEEFSEETVYSAFQEVLNDPSYSKNMSELQKKFLDRQNKPLDTALWWIEYILRIPEPDHLSPFSRNMSFIQANSLDILFGYFVFVLIIYIVLLILLNLWRKFNKAFEKPSKHKMH